MPSSRVLPVHLMFGDLGVHPSVKAADVVVAADASLDDVLAGVVARAKVTPVTVAMDRSLDPGHVLGILLTELQGRLCPTSLACIVSARDLWSALSVGETADVCHDSAMVAAQVECSSAVVIIDWGDLDRDKVARLMGMVRMLNPHADLVLESSMRWRPIAGAHPLTLMNRAGWMRVLSDVLPSPLDVGSLGWYRYQNPRPFHPGRLADALDVDLVHGGDRILRSIGFCQFATRADMTALWTQVGAHIRFDPLPDRGVDTVSLGQDIAFLGERLDTESLRRTLDSCTLTDDELIAGPVHWVAMADPLPAWE